MENKVIEYGTKHSVIVHSASKSAIIVVADEIKEGFVLMGHGLKKLPKEGDSGTIVFKRGGPTGGYWHFNADQRTGT